MINPTDHISIEEVFEKQDEIQKKIESLRKQAAKTLYDNQECYVAQWILHNPDKNPADYYLEFECRLDGHGYNVRMKRLDEKTVVPQYSAGIKKGE